MVQNRNLFLISSLKKKPLIKKLLKGKKTSNGRNNSGKITVRHKGGGHKRRYRKISFKRIEKSLGIITSFEYDPNRNCHIASVFEVSSQKFFYIIAPKSVRIGDIIQAGPDAEPRIGHSLPISKIPVGSLIHNVSIKKNANAKLSRSAGTFAILKEKTFDSSVIELSSGDQKLVSTSCYATIGSVSNELFVLKQLYKAGQSRWLNRRPSVRGVAMNPVDHPHGGGEGKKSGKGRTPWGKPVKKGATGKPKTKLITTKNEVDD